MHFQALVLDMDGTMVDTERVLIGLWDAVAREMGHVFAMEVMVATVGTTYEDTEKKMRTTYPDAPHDVISREVSRRFNPMRDTGGIPVKEGLYELVEAARKKGLLLGVCTSTRRGSAEATVASLELTDSIDAMVCGGEAEAGKPDPAPYLLMAERLGVAPQACIVVEDSPHGAQAALAAGMTVAVVPDLVKVPELVAARTTVLSSLLEVIPLLK